MKNFGLRITFSGILLFIFGSILFAQTPSKPYKPLSGIKNVEVIGTVQAIFQARRSLANEAAYVALLEAAKKEYRGTIDVGDIIVIRGKDVPGPRMFEFTASGKVVLLGGNNRKSNTAISGVEGALERAAEQVSENFPARAKIAIVYITAQNRSTTDYIAGELEYIWVNNGYTIIDRNQLDRLRNEQNFQISGEIDDKTAVSIGKFTGANIIVTGRVDGEGNLSRLRLRALDTQTAQVIGAASERL